MTRVKLRGRADDHSAPAPTGSLWQHGLPPWTRRDPPPGDRDADVAVVGAGFTGLWTAYHLLRADPSLRVVLLEREQAGFGASGRNGGWCSAIFPATMRKVAAHAGREGAVAMQRAMNATVAEIADTVRAEGIDCDLAAGGFVDVARGPAQWERAKATADGWRSWGFGDDFLRLLDRAETADLVRMTGTSGGTFTPHCLALHPLKLVRGLVGAVERLGATLHESTAVTAIEPRRVRTERGTLRADVVVRATEGYTPQLPGGHRDVVPMYSLMVATEPLPASFWDEVGLVDRPTFSDFRHLRIYGQRTADGRIAFGGRGAPYHFGSRVSPAFDSDARVHAMLRRILADLLPGAADAGFSHAWGGNLGIPRDWYPSVGYDPGSGLAFAGGYVGDGVATAHLAGRTLTDLVLGRRTELTRLPWLTRRSPRWEPEPLRWLGVNAGTLVFAAADRTEARTGRPSRMAAGFWRLLGH